MLTSVKGTGTKHTSNPSVSLESVFANMSPGGQKHPKSQKGSQKCYTQKSTGLSGFSDQFPRERMVFDMKLGAEQKLAIANLGASHVALVNAKVFLKQKIEDAYKLEMTKLEVDRSIAANRCLSLGVPKTQIRAQLRTSSWDTMMSVLKLSADSFQSEEDIAADMAAAEPFEITATENTPWDTPFYSYVEKSSGTVGTITVNRSGKWMITWMGDSNSSPRKALKTWFHEKTGFGDLNAY